MPQQFDYEIAPAYKTCEREIRALVSNFNRDGETLFHKRNTIKRMQLGNAAVAVKSFRIPGFVQSLIYGLCRKSKARRSFEHALKLQQLEISTPAPVAYLENKKGGRLQDSYYICLLSDATMDMADILQSYDDSAPSKDIIRAFTQFTFDMHERNVLHIDHNSGNTLVSKSDEGIHFSVIDINRMRFKPLNIRQRLNNFVRLTDDTRVLDCIAETYAQCSGLAVDDSKSLLAQLKQRHLNKLALKRKIKSIFRKPAPQTFSKTERNDKNRALNGNINNSKRGDN